MKFTNLLCIKRNIVPVAFFTDKPLQASSAFNYNIGIKHTDFCVRVYAVFYASPMITIIKVKHIQYFFNISYTAFCCDILPHL